MLDSHLLLQIALGAVASIVLIELVIAPFSLIKRNGDAL